jgi:hypothetical protein|uniref:Uncharacterized protein n=1 Tax=viral metagenome TaxID=1070528 RepID=A0A6C0ECT6_9ZZZZ
MNHKIIDEFNEIVIALLTQLCQFIGVAYLKQFKKIIKYNSIMPIEQFLVNALPYRDKILERDESYFNNNNDYRNILKDDTNTLNEILKLKDIFNNLDNESKNNIWDFFQAMLILSEEFLKNKVERYL